MAKLPSIGKLPAGLRTLATRELVCTTGGSNKHYTGVLAEDPTTGDFYGGARYGRIGGPSSQSAVWYRGPHRNLAEDAIRQMLREKLDKGRSRYETADGLSLAPLFTSPLPSSSQGASTPSAVPQPSRAPVSLRDAFTRRRG